MTRSHALALSSAALLTLLSSPSFAQTIRSGLQCVPDVANVSLYQNCRLRIVAGQEVCRCAIRPQALRRLNGIRDLDALATGSVNRSLTGSRFGEGTPGTGAAIGGGTLGSGSTGTSATSGAVGGGSAGRGTGGSVADSGGRTGSGNMSGVGGDGTDSGSNGPGNNNGLGNGSEPADNTDTDVKGTDPSNPGAGDGRGGNNDAGRGGGNGGRK